MTPDNDAPDDALTRDYQRRSAADAGRPAAATRAAILAEARQLAQRRGRARRDPRIPWALAASVSVIGIAVVLWHQVAPQTKPLMEGSPMTPVAVAPQSPAPPVGDRAVPTTPAPREPAGRNAAARAAPAPDAKALALATASDVAPPAAPAAPALARAKEESTSEGAADAMARVRAESAAGAAVASAPAARASGLALQATDSVADAQAPAQLVKQYFPAVSASDSPPHTLWLLRDARGVVLQSGTVNDRAGLAGVAADLQRAAGARRIGAWMITPLTTEHGVPVDLAVATLFD
jgi:hypothetical protein